MFDEENKIAHLDNFFSDLFECEAQPLPEWVSGSWDLDALQNLPTTDGYLIKRAVSFLKEGKTCSEDHLVAEMLKYFDDNLYDYIADLFRARLLNAEGEEEGHAWGHHLVSLLIKQTGAKRLKDFRTIAILPALYKLSSWVLMLLIPELLHGVSRYQFALRKYYQAGEISFCLRSLSKKAKEWSNCADVSLCVLDGDLLEIYDMTQRSRVIRSRRKKGIPHIVTAAWLRHHRKMSSTFVLDNATKSRPILRNRSLIQGDPAAPYLFELARDQTILDFVSLCKAKGWGMEIAGDSIPIFAWAGFCLAICQATRRAELDVPGLDRTSKPRRMDSAHFGVLLVFYSGWRGF